MPRRLRLLLRHAGLLREAFLSLWATRIGLTFGRCGRLRQALRPGDVEPDPAALQTSSSSPAKVDPIVWAVRHAARLVLGGTCLTQAITGQALLLRRGVPSTVRIGVRRDGRGDFQAHAWLVCEGRTVLGGAFEPGPGFVPITDLVPDP